MAHLLSPYCLHCCGQPSYGLVAIIEAPSKKLQVVRVEPPEAYDNFFPGAREMREMKLIDSVHRQVGIR